MTHFWAKTTAEGMPGISVFEHMVNVGCVARCIAETSPKILERFHLQSSVVGALAALHDLGKISPGFQRKCETWLEENGLTKIARNGCWDTGMESDHGVVSHSAIQEFLVQQCIPRNIAKYLAAVLGAHHGKIKFRPDSRGIKPPLIKHITENISDIDWDDERQKYAQKLWHYFNIESSVATFNNESPALWWLAGLTSVADWIGSNEQFFPPEHRTSDKDVSALAGDALNAIGFQRTQFKRGLSFHDLFHDLEKPEARWIPNEMQEKTLATVSGPGVYVVEAPMGMGKTEAALWAAYQLLVSGKATGIYFALPTQATSNRIHLRMNEFLRRIAPGANASRLIHGNSWLMETDYCIYPAATDAKGEMADDARRGGNGFPRQNERCLPPSVSALLTRHCLVW